MFWITNTVPFIVQNERTQDTDVAIVTVFVSLFSSIFRAQIAYVDSITQHTFALDCSKTFITGQQINL